MSDWVQKPLPNTDANKYTADMGPVKDFIGDSGKKTFYGMPINDNEYVEITRLLSASPDPKTESYKLANALQYARLYDTNISTVYSNLDSYNVNFLGKSSELPKDNWLAVADSLKSGYIQLKLNSLGRALMDKGGSDAGLEKEIDDCFKEQNELEDKDPNRNAIIKSLEWAASSVPYNIATQLPTVGVLVAGSIIGTPAAGIAAASAFTTASGSYLNTVGNEYIRMRKMGFSHDVAYITAPVEAAINGVIESQLGLDTLFGSELSKGAIHSITDSAIKMIYANGIIPSVAAKTIGRVAGGALEEGMQDFSQSLVESVGDYVASIAESENNTKIDVPKFKDSLKDAVDQGLQGAAASLWFGVAGNSIAAYKDVKGMQELHSAATVMSKDQYVEAVKSSQVGKQIYEGMSDEAIDQAISNSWDNANKALTEEDKSAKQSPVVRNSNGALYGSVSVIGERSDGSIDSVYTIANPKTGESYGDIRYKLHAAENGQYEIVVTENNINKSAGIGVEALVQLESMYSGVPFTTDGTSTERAVDLVNRVTNGNPNGEKAGAQWFSSADTGADEAALNKLRTRISDALPNASTSQVEIATALHRAWANANGMSMNDYLSSRFQDSIVEANDEEVQKQFNEAKASGEVSGERALGATSFDKESKAIIYLAKNANFETFMHESFHVWQSAIEGTELGNKLAAAYGVENGIWTNRLRERAAKDFTVWSSYGEVDNPTLKGIFWQAGRWLRETWNSLKSREQVSPELAKAFTSMFSSDKSPISEQNIQSTEADLKASEPLAAKPEESAPSQSQVDEQRAEQNPIVSEQAKQAVTPESVNEGNNAAVNEDEGKLSKVANEIDSKAANESPGEVSARLNKIADKMESGTYQWDKQELQDQSNHSDELEAILKSRYAEASARAAESASQSTAIASEENKIREVPVSAVTLCPDVPNFKQGAGEDGTVEKINATHYIRLGTGPIVVWQRTNGDLQVITGRHRLDLAKRLGELTIPAQIVRESDGFTVEMATILDAESNIRDGQGRIVDYVRFFRDAGYTKEQAKERGLIRQDKSRIAFAIAENAQDGLLSAYLAGKIGADKAAAIAQASGKSASLQALGMSIARNNTAEQIASVIIYTKNNIDVDASQLDMFGNDDALIVEGKKMAAQAEKIISGLRSQLDTLYKAKALSDKDRSALLEKNGVKISADTASLDKAIVEINADISKWLGWATDRELSNKIRDMAGLKPKSGPTIEETHEIIKADIDTDTPTMFEVDESTELTRAAQEKYQVTVDPSRASLIMPDGVMLDLGDSDIHEIGSLVGEGSTFVDFLRETGAIAVDFGDGTAYSVNPPTIEASATLSKYAKNNGTFTIQVDNDDGELVGKKTFGPGDRDFENFYNSPKINEDSKKVFNSISDASDAVRAGLSDRGVRYSVRYSQSSNSRYYDYVMNGELRTIRVSDHEANQYAHSNLNLTVGDSSSKLNDFLDSNIGKATFTGESLIQRDTNVVYDPDSSSEQQEHDNKVLFEPEESPEKQDNKENVFVANKGKFTNKLSDPGKLEEFLGKLWDKIEAEYGEGPESRTERLLDGNPFVLGSVYSYGKNGKISEQSRKVVLGIIRNNELPFKELYGSVMNDTETAFEAKAERKAIGAPTEVNAKKYQEYATMGVAEQSAIINKIRDKDVREKIANNSITDTEITDYIKRLESDRKKLATKINEYEKQVDSKKALSEALHSAREEERLQLNMVVEDIKATERLRQQREALRKNIMSAPGRDMMFSEKEKIRTIQQYLAGKRWETERTENGGYRKTGAVITPSSIGKVIEIITNTPGISDMATDSLISSIEDKPLAAWSTDDLKTLNEIITNLGSQGRAFYLDMVEARQDMWAAKRLRIARSLRTSSEYKQPEAGGTYGDKEIVKKLNGKYTWDFTTANMDRISRYYLDRGNPDKTNFKILVEEKRKHQSAQWSQMDKRVGKVKAFMANNNINPSDLYKRVEIPGAGPHDGTAKFSISDLMMAMLAVRNDQTRDAFTYGNLFDNVERTKMGPDAMVVAGEQRLNKVLEAIDNQLTPQQKALAEVIAKDFDDNFDRLNAAAINYSQNDIQKVSNYVPLVRINEVFSTLSEEILTDLLRGQGFPNKAGPNNSMTKARFDIIPNSQTAMKLDLFSTYMDSVDKQEHFIEFSDYHRELINIYGENGSKDSREIRETIKHTYGDIGLRYIDDYINEVANPQNYKQRNYADALLHKLRGNFAVAALAGRVVSVANQLATSPIPYVAYAPAQMVTAAAKCVSNPRGFIAEVEGKSPFLRNRQRDPIYHIWTSMDDGLAKTIGEKGMKGLEWADRWSVAIGWEAVYENELSKTHNEEAAIKKADDITYRCQPTADSAEMSPLFRNNSEAMRMLTQFGSQLNVVYQQMRFDTVIAARDQHYGEAIGIIVGMGLQGLALGTIRQLRGKDQPDDPEDKWREWLYYLVSQPFECLPLVGNMASVSVKRVITGDKRSYTDNDTFPVVGGILSGVTGLAEGHTESGIMDIAESIGFATGLPVQAIKDYCAPIVGLVKDK